MESKAQNKGQGKVLVPMSSYLLGGRNLVQFENPISNKFGDKHPAQVNVLGPACKMPMI